MEAFYVTVCPDTGRVFICQRCNDDNIAEAFCTEDGMTARGNADYIVEQLNRKD